MTINEFYLFTIKFNAFLDWNNFVPAVEFRAEENGGMNPMVLALVKARLKIYESK